ncbi:IGSF9B [Mytilus edulis]|uniref:IGSF9B n=1 Tax=Mytilus edulis TaxID=6550 RepID=A0A8S3UG17_MYTED|nr:IGSF9B [Mytilus edulis]
MNIFKKISVILCFNYHITGPINSGETLHVTCSISGGNPLAILTWNCSGTAINKSSEKSAFLDIAFTVGQQDDGTICTCFASHLIATYNATAEKVVSLKVYYNTSVTEVTVLNGSTFSENLTAILRCQVTGNPLPNVTWYFLSNETKQILQRQHRIVESSYTINTTNCMHTGIYECATENTVNGTKVMNRVPIAPVHIYVICKTKSLHVLWMSEFNGGREQTFFVEYWISLQPNNKSRSGPVMDLGESTSIKYDIKGLLPRTNYSVRILASNANGISVSEKVECLTDLENAVEETTTERDNSWREVQTYEELTVQRTAPHIIGNSRREYENTDIKDNGMLKGFMFNVMLYNKRLPFLKTGFRLTTYNCIYYVCRKCYT